MITTSENDQHKNLQNIQRIDNSAVEILMQCTQAALYEFNLLDNKWTNTETMGPLFVYKRTAPPFYSLLIANRQSLNDYVEPIVENLNLKYDPPYILIHREDGAIRGVWIFGEDECKKIFNRITDLQKQETSKVNAATNISLQSSNSNNVDANTTAEVVFSLGSASARNNDALKENNQKSNETPVTTKTKRLNQTKNECTKIFNRICDLQKQEASKVNTVKSTNTATKFSLQSSNSNKVANITTAEVVFSSESSLATVGNNDALKENSKKSSGSPITSKSTGNTNSNEIRNTFIILLRRIDPFASELILYSPNAVLYEYQLSEKKWDLANIHGPLFIFKRLDKPIYSLMITDKEQLDQFVQPLITTLRIKLRASYIFMQQTDDKIYGIWTPNKEESKRIHNRLLILIRIINGGEGGEVSCWDTH